MQGILTTSLLPSIISTQIAKTNTTFQFGAITSKMAFFIAIETRDFINVTSLLFFLSDISSIDINS